MPRTTLLAVLSLDGAWRTEDASPSVLRRLLGAVGMPESPVWTDIPQLRPSHRLLPGLRRATTARLLAEALASSRREPLILLGTPVLHAALLAAPPSRGGGLDLLVLQRPEIVLGPDRATLAAPFLPADGRRVRFRLLSARGVEEGSLCRYRSISLPKKSIPR